jgi:hypothetical protein
MDHTITGQLFTNCSTANLKNNTSCWYPEELIISKLRIEDYTTHTPGCPKLKRALSFAHTSLVSLGCVEKPEKKKEGSGENGVPLCRQECQGRHA